MQFIQVDQSKEGLTRDIASYVEGNVRYIMILSENDMSLENLPLVLHSKQIDLLYVPEIPSEEQMRIIYPYLFDGYERTGKIKVI